MAGIIVAFLGVFEIPWFVPLSEPVCGESYSFGFSNKAAVLGLLTAMALILIGRIRNGKKSTDLAWFIASPVIFPPFRKAVYDYIALGLSSLICVVAVLVWNAYLVIPYWSESDNFLSRIDLARLGYSPLHRFSIRLRSGLYLRPDLDRLVVVRDSRQRRCLWPSV